MKRCLDCGKIIWPWQAESNLNLGLKHIHAACHSISVTAYINTLKGKPLFSALRELAESGSNVKYLGINEKEKRSDNL